MKLLLKIALLLPLACAPVVAMAAHSGGHSYSRGGGPVHVIRGGRSHFGSYATFGLGIGLGYALTSPYYYGYPYSSWYYGPPREVIVERNTYIDEPAPVSETRVYTNRQETSLLRDLQGHCYERTYDSNGRELRTELDPKECNF